MDFLSIAWVNDSTLVCHGRSLDFGVSDDLVARAAAVPVKSLFQQAPLAAFFHEARDFLRHALLAGEARRRPKDFGGLENGWSESRFVRESTYALLLHRSGPSLVTAGIWTSLAMSRIGTYQHPNICARCQLEVETTMHRLWHCPANQPFRNRLDRVLSVVDPVNILPPCVLRCGLIPRDLRLGIGDVTALHQNLSAVNDHATTCLAAARRGRCNDLPLDVFPRRSPSDAIYAVALPPLKRKKPGGVVAQSAPPTDVVFPSPSPWRLVSQREDILVAIDGSSFVHDEESFSGWGFTVSWCRFPNLLDFCGPTQLDPQGLGHIGAGLHSNNVAELSAVYYALRFVCLNCANANVIVYYDSEYAAAVTRRIWRAHANFALVLRARAALDAVASTSITWTKVASHTGDMLNDRADLLAKCGANGIFRSSHPELLHSIAVSLP